MCHWELIKLGGRKAWPDIRTLKRNGQIVAQGSHKAMLDILDARMVDGDTFNVVGDLLGTIDAHEWAFYGCVGALVDQQKAGRSMYDRPHWLDHHQSYSFSTLRRIEREMRETLKQT